MPQEHMFVKRKNADILFKRQKKVYNGPINQREEFP